MNEKPSFPKINLPLIILISFSLAGLLAGGLFFVRSRPVEVTIGVEETTSGRPLVGVPVVAQQENQEIQPSWTETDEHGHAHFRDLKPGLVTFRVSIPDYKDFFQSVTLKRGGNDAVSFLLEVETAELKGQVLNAQNRVPVSGAVVLVGGVVGETDEEGRFILDEVVVGTQTLRVQKSGFQDFSVKVQLDRGMVKDVGELFLKAEI